ncbi:MAG: hypothetical protein AB2421_08340 [Thermotaleaceae bacterium]
MSDGEFLIFAGSSILTFYNWKAWYQALIGVWPQDRGKKERIWLGIFPLICISVIFLVLKNYASFDVVGSLFYILFYILLGSAWLELGKYTMFIVFDLSWRDDAIENNNRAAVFALSGALIGLTAIYAGANIGDGPGWWCVLVAGGFAFILWLLLLKVICILDNPFERITVDRDEAAGLRMGFYMLSSGFVLGRGAAGDWTSSEQTLYELLDAWPVLFLTALAILVERMYRRRGFEDTHLGHSILWGCLYIFAALLIVYLLPPLPHNSLYGIF